MAPPGNNQQIVVPLYHKKLPNGQYALIFPLDVEVETVNGFRKVPYIIDVSSDFSTIDNDDLTNSGVVVLSRGTAGTAQLVDVWHSFPSIPHLKFRTTCQVVTRGRGPSPKRRRLAFRDIFQNFEVDYEKFPTQRFVLTLRRTGHTGVDRP